VRPGCCTTRSLHPSGTSALAATRDSRIIEEGGGREVVRVEGGGEAQWPVRREQRPGAGGESVSRLCPGWRSCSHLFPLRCSNKLAIPSAVHRGGNSGFPGCIGRDGFRSLRLRRSCPFRSCGWDCRAAGSFRVSIQIHQSSQCSCSTAPFLSRHLLPTRPVLRNGSAVTQWTAFDESPVGPSEEHLL
jgi:hypothetical protein